MINNTSLMENVQTISTFLIIKKQLSLAKKGICLFWRTEYQVLKF